MQATPRPNPWFVALVSLAMALGCAGLLLLAGFWLGSQVRPTGDSNGYFDTRGLNTVFAALFLGCGGLISGLVGGFFLGRFMALRYRHAALPVSVVVLALPIVIWNIHKNRMVEDAQLSAQRYSAEAQKESARQIAQRDQYLASSQYAEVVQKQLAELQQFEAQMGPITYPNSTLASSPSPRMLVFETDDNVGQIRDFFKRAPVTMGYFDNGPTTGYVYWTLGPMKGSIYIAGKQGTVRTKTIQYNIESP